MLRTTTVKLDQELTYLSLADEIETEESGLWDNSHIAPRHFVSSCCQAPIDSHGAVDFCTSCGEDITSEVDLLEETDEEEFIRQDREESMRSYWRDIEDYN